MEYAIGILPQDMLEGVLEFKKLDFMGLKCQFDVKKANIRGLTAKFGRYRPILPSRHHL